MDSTPAPDVLVIGGGTSGSVLAARLSEDPGVRVLLLEEGADHSEYDQTITAATAGQSASLSRRFAQGLALDMAGVSVPLARGRVLGGTSAVNYMATVRGAPADYDAWAAQGNAGWAWSDVLPVFRRIETDLDHPGSPIHGHQGPLTVRRWGEETFAPAHAAFLHGLAEVGVPVSPDINDPAHLRGVGAFPASVTRAGRRVTVSEAYLTPRVRARPNLEIRTGIRVASLEARRGRVHGARLSTGEVIAAGEVYVAAGAVESPALLLRSGIGPAAELAALGIGPVHDLPVGLGLQDHLGSAIPYRIEDSGVGAGGPAQTVWIDGGAEGGPPHTHVFPVLLPGAGGSGPAPGAFAMLIFSMRPEDRGAVRLRPDRPTGRPLIQVPRPSDREYAAHRDAVEVLRAWESSGPARGAGVRRCEQGHRELEADASALWLQTPASYAHLTSSCAMGPDPRTAVVDSRCRVHGLDGLRVADASALPAIPAGNTYLTCVMLAENVVQMARGQAAGGGSAGAGSARRNAPLSASGGEHKM